MRYKTPFLLTQLIFGNWGDELERMGLRKHLKEEGLVFEEVKYGELPQKIDEFKTVLIFGVGGIGRFYKEFSEKVHNLCSTYPNKLFVIAPTTAMLHEDFLRERYLHDNLIFFARELTTYNFMKWLGLKRVYLDECCALKLRKEDLEEFLEDEEEIWERALFLRGDGEKVDFGQDLQKLFDATVTLDPVREAKSFEEWVRIHQRARTVYTNRLHSALLSLILGKKVFVFRNFYHKLRSVWKHSLKRRGVGWIGV